MCSAPTPLAVRADDVRPGIVRVRAAAGTLGSFAVAELGSAIDAALAQRPWGIVVDLRPLEAVTPAGLTMLLRVAHAAGELDIGLSMVCPAVVRSALDDLDLAELFDLHYDLDPALASLGVVVKRLPAVTSAARLEPGTG
jgi:anti-anti-sigma regulatory factor